MKNNNPNQNGKEILSSLLPKINEYFSKNQYLEKSKLPEFLSYIDISLTTEKDKDLEKFWSTLSKNSSKEKISKENLIQNLSEYILKNKKEILQPQQNLNNSVLEFISNPKNLNISIDPDNDEHFELYRLFATLNYNKDKVIHINYLEEQLNKYNFINLDKKYLSESISDLVKEKVNELKKEQYMLIMKEMGKKFEFVLEERSKQRKVFTQEELDHAELKEFDDIEIIIKILFDILHSIYTTDSQFSLSIKNKDDMNSDYLDKYFNIFIENLKLYLFEIYRIYNLQKQKFNYYENVLENKNFHNKQKILQLNEEIKKQKDIQEMANYDNLKALNEEIIKERNKYKNLENEIKSIKIEKQKIYEDNILLENKIKALEKNLEEKQNKINSLNNENELISKKYREVLDTLNKQIYNAKEKERSDNQAFKNMNLDEKHKLLINKNPQQLISYIVEKDNYCLTLENKNKTLLKKITELEKNQEETDNEFYKLKSQVLTLENKNSNLEKENSELQKQVEEYHNKSGVYLNNLLEEENDEEKKYNYIQVKASQFNYKAKIKKELEERNYDYLCLKMNAKVLQNLQDQYYNGRSNLFFSELINYLDEEKQITECALFITSEYLYFFNNITFHKGLSVKLDELRTVFISKLNNYVSMTFYEGLTINFELFRILDLMSFIKSLNALHKTKRQIQINMSDFNNQFVRNISNNFTVCAYHGKAIFSGYVNKRVEKFWKTEFEKKFISLTEIGLIIMEKPNGKPLDIINLTFAEWDVYNDDDGNYCFVLYIGVIKHTFSVDSEFIRNKWILEFDKWKKKAIKEESITV